MTTDTTPATAAILPPEYRRLVARLEAVGLRVEVSTTELPASYKIAHVYVEEPDPYGPRLTFGVSLAVGRSRPRFLGGSRWYGGSASRPTKLRRKRDLFYEATSAEDRYRWARRVEEEAEDQRVDATRDWTPDPEPEEPWTREDQRLHESGL